MIQRNIKEGDDFSFIYADPTKFIRVLELNRSAPGEATYPAHVITRGDKEIPLRIFDSGMEIIHSKDVSFPSTVGLPDPEIIQGSFQAGPE